METDKLPGGEGCLSDGNGEVLLTGLPPSVINTPVLSAPQPQSSRCREGCVSVLVFN